MTVEGTSESGIWVDRLAKRFGRRTVLEQISFTVQPGQVYALAGPNGSGKTTLIHCVCGLTFPTRGQVRLGGEDVHARSVAAHAKMGALVESPAAFYGHLSGRENLRLHARLAARGGLKVSEDRIREVFTLLELVAVADRPVSVYSLGQRQRLGVAAAILGHPQVLILDEPTSGLDPLGIGLIHRVLAELASEGCAVLLSTHHLREVASYASVVGILGAGRLIDQVDLKLRQRAYRFLVDQPAKAAAALQSLPGVRRAQTRSPYAVALLDSEQVIPGALRQLQSDGVAVFEVGPDVFDLYEYYRDRMEQVY